MLGKEIVEIPSGKQGIIFPNKAYFKIGEVAKILGIKSHVIRYWESEFNVIRPFKTKSQHRLFRRKDLIMLSLIKDLLHVRKFTVDGARKYLKQDLEAKKQLEAAIEATIPIKEHQLILDQQKKIFQSQLLELRSHLEIVKASLFL